MGNRNFSVFVLLLALILSTSGCYHAEVVTGRPASDTVVEEEWMLGFVYGLVVPNELDVRQECDAGVARVETKLSFLNQVVSGLTGGLFTPMHVTVTCAEGSETADAEMIRSEGKDVGEALETAAQHSRSKKKAVYVRFTE